MGKHLIYLYFSINYDSNIFLDRKCPMPSNTVIEIVRNLEIGDQTFMFYTFNFVTVVVWLHSTEMTSVIIYLIYYLLFYKDWISRWQINSVYTSENVLKKFIHNFKST